MARYRGPKAKIARRFREPIFGPSKALDKKPYGPGMHGNTRRRSKQSEYAIQLAEKQKAKYTYGVLERQFAKTFALAVTRKGITGENLLKFLESRLDNVVYRMAIAPTRQSARQLVLHKHILVNNEIVNIPSYQLRAGDTIEVREKSKSLEAITNSLASGRKKFGWIEWNDKDLKGTFVSMPDRAEIPENINEQLIVELYSK